MARREDGPPQVDRYEGSEDTDEEEEECEESPEEEEDDNKPPPMNDSSGSGTDSVDLSPPRVYNMRNAEGKWTKIMAASANQEAPRATKRASSPKTPKSAVSSKATGKVDGESPIWTQFTEYRAGLTNVDRFGIVALKEWENLARNDAIPQLVLSWYDDQIKGNRLVPRAMAVQGLPSGFPEFCHWIEEGLYKPSDPPLKPGFQTLAVKYVRKVKLALADGAGPQLAASKNSTVESSKLRRRERRLARKGATSPANEELVVKVQKTLAELETITCKEPGNGAGVKSATGRAFRAGLDAEEEMRRRMASAVAVEGDANDIEVNLVDTHRELTPGARSILEGLTRIRTYRRRAERQFDLMEAELERCYSKVVRIETQYQALVAETPGRESSPNYTLACAVPMIEEAGKLVNANVAGRALGLLSNAVKLLEVHVVDSPSGSQESEEILRAREALGLALFNRSVANLRVGNAYNAQDDAKRAVEVWPVKVSKEHLDRCLAHLSKEGAQIKRPNWKALTRLP